MEYPEIEPVVRGENYSYETCDPRIYQWLRGLRGGSTAARLLGLRVPIPPRAWMSVSCECSVLSGRGLCIWLITHPEDSYRVWCV
jgi:hypothetical protein